VEAWRDSNLVATPALMATVATTFAFLHACIAV
jgi:hypothetical protein